MSPASPNANFEIPAGITEADLVDLVDGHLPKEREAKVVALLSADARLQSLIGLMRTDRTSLSQLAAVSAPAGLADAIEARLQSEALRDLAHASEEAPASIPISSVRVRRPSVLPALLESVWTRRLAMAASVALLSGGALWGVQALVRRGTPAPIEVAHNTPATNDGRAPAVPTEPAPTELVLIDNSAATNMGPEPTLAMAAPRQPMTDTRITELARAGRLVITIHAPSAQTALKKLDTLAKAGAHEGWRTIPMDRVPSELASLTVPSFPLAVPDATRPDAPAFASEKPGAGAPPSESVPSRARTIVKAIYTAEVNPGDRWLNGLVRTLTDALPPGAALELRETPSISPAGAPVDPDSVLWWNAQPGKWAKKTMVPIVVEGLE